MSQDYKKTWTWQMIYFTFSRAVIVAALYYVATHCLSLLKSYLHIAERNSHRLMVIKSMPSLVESAKEIDREKIYYQLLSIIVNYDETGLLKEELGVKFDHKDLKDFLLKATDKISS
jgi:hypothetical protein